MLLVILAAAVIKGITGDEGIINVTESAAEEYTLEQYKEQIMQVTQSTIVAYAVSGTEAGMAEIANSIKEELSWVKTSNETSKDVIVIASDGNIFEVYYDVSYGKIYVEHIGEEKRGEIPSLEVSYTNKTITAVPGENLTKLEVIYGGESKDITSTKTYNIEEGNTGWYTVKTSTNNGNTRYRWIKAVNYTDKLTVPEINLGEPDGQNKWYITEPGATITQNNGSDKEIHYTIIGVNGEGYNTEIIKEGTIVPADEIKIKPGITRITAWVEEGGGRTKEVTKTVKFDNVLPNISKVTINGKEIQGEGEEANWITEKAEIKTEITDEVGIVEGYQYEVYDIRKAEIIKSKEETIDADRPIQVETDGRYKITITAVDQAGNISSSSRIINVNKDSTPPAISEPRISGNTGASFIITISAGDEISEIAENGYEFFVSGQSESIKKNTGICEVTGLSGEKDYEVYVKVRNKAGLEATSITVPVSMKVNVDSIGSSATAEQILEGFTAYTDGRLTVGIMPNRGELNQQIGVNDSYTLAPGYYSGGRITSIMGATTAGAGDILKGKTAYINGALSTGTMENRGNLYWRPQTSATYTVPAGYYTGGTIITDDVWTVAYREGAASASATGNAGVGDVLSGKTFSNASGKGLTGTMANRGNLDWSGSNTTYTVPSGYYSGGTLDSRPSYNAGVSQGRVEGRSQLHVNKTISMTIPGTYGSTGPLPHVEVPTCGANSVTVVGSAWRSSGSAACSVAAGKGGCGLGSSSWSIGLPEEKVTLRLEF